MASTGGAVRTVLLSANITGVTTRIFRDIAPPETTYPYITIGDEITNTPALLGDKLVKSRTRQLRVNLWQVRTSENTTIIDSVVSALDNATLASNKVVFGCRVIDVQRLYDATDDIVLHAATLNVTQGA